MAQLFRCLHEDTCKDFERVWVDHTVLLMPQVFDGGRALASLSLRFDFLLETGETATINVATVEEIYLEGKLAVGSHEKGGDDEQTVVEAADISE